MSSKLFSNSNQTETLESESILLEVVKIHKIILYNDDVNTFEHVIFCLMEYCQHEMVQAEQVAHLVHYKGKCDVKSGTFEELKPICEALLNKGLSAKIE